MTLGVIKRYRCVGNEAQVNPVGWGSLDVGQRKSLVISLTLMCDEQRSGNRMTVFDAQSGEVRARTSGGTVTIVP